MNDEQLRDQINQLIRDEIQEDINDYVDAKEQSEKAGLGFVEKDDEQELKVKISNREVDRLIKEYKKIKKASGLTYLKLKSWDWLIRMVTHLVDIISK